MKKLIIACLILLVIGVSLIVTKPSDDQCIELMKSKLEQTINDNSNNQFLAGVLTIFINSGMDRIKNVFRVQDNTFYKDVYLSDVKIGTAIFGTLIVSDDFQNKISSIRNSVDEREQQVVQSEPVSRLKSIFKKKEEPHYEGNDIQSLQNELSEAQIKLQKLKQFHLLRSTKTREAQISQQEQYIQSLEDRIRTAQN